MSNDLMLDVGQANELKLAFRRANYSNDDIKRLCEGNVLAEVRRVLLAHASITAVDNTIDCDATPFNPWEKDGWKVESHQKAGQLAFEQSQVEFYLADGQKNGRTIVGNKLRKELAKKPVLNANVLDYLLANPDLIPEEWKTDEGSNTRYIFFWGTVYRSRYGRLFVRCLYWSGGRWDSRGSRLSFDWHGHDPAAVRAS